MADSPEVMVEHYTNLKQEQILAMEAGRELDALVAEKVMAIVPERDEDFQHDGYRVGSSWYSHIPFYSSDISSAWEVVEKVDISEISKSYRTGGEWYWGVCINGKYTYSKSVPEAICKAALLAVVEE